jgi:hypothetical protein
MALKSVAISMFPCRCAANRRFIETARGLVARRHGGWQRSAVSIQVGHSDTHQRNWLPLRQAYLPPLYHRNMTPPRGKTICVRPEGRACGYRRFSTAKAVRGTSLGAPDNLGSRVAHCVREPANLMLAGGARQREMALRRLGASTSGSFDAVGGEPLPRLGPLSGLCWPRLWAGSDCVYQQCGESFPSLYPDLRVLSFTVGLRCSRACSLESHPRSGQRTPTPVRS